MGTSDPRTIRHADVSEAATASLIYLATIVAAGWFLVFLAPLDNGMRQRPDGQPRRPTRYRRGARAGWRRLATPGAPQRKAKLFRAPLRPRPPSSCREARPQTGSPSLGHLQEGASASPHCVS